MYLIFCLLEKLDSSNIPRIMTTEKTNSPDSKVIDRLGGTSVVARMFKIKDPSVSYWRIHGIPEARRMYLEAVYPHLFEPEQSVEAASYCENHNL